jgi:hypothetical protein
MKRFTILIALAVIVTASCFTQQINQVFANDTTKGAVNKYFTATRQVLLYQGLITMQFTSSHDIAWMYPQGSNGGTVWRDIDTINVTGSATVNHIWSDPNPEYVYYRMHALGKAGDTCYFSNVRIIYKY